MGRGDGGRYRISGWLLVSPVVSAAVVALDTASGSIPVAVGVPIAALAAAVVAGLAYRWWRGRGLPPAPRRPSTSRWGGGRPEERWR